MIPIVWRALEQTDWMWVDHDKLEVIIRPRYFEWIDTFKLRTFKKRGERVVEKEEDLCEMIMYLFFIGVDGEMMRANPWCNEIDVGLNSR